MRTTKQENATIPSFKHPPWILGDCLRGWLAAGHTPPRHTQPLHATLFWLWRAIRPPQLVAHASVAWRPVVGYQIGLLSSIWFFMTVGSRSGVILLVENYSLWLSSTNSWNSDEESYKTILVLPITEFFQSSTLHVILHQRATSSSTKHLTKMYWWLIIAARHVILH
jgi:hypothetical protein